MQRYGEFLQDAAYVVPAQDNQLFRAVGDEEDGGDGGDEGDEE